MKDLNKDDIFIINAQKEIIKLGYQFQEQIFNNCNESSQCYLEIAISKDPLAFDDQNECAGWGRMSRLHCWENALKWAKK